MQRSLMNHSLTTPNKVRRRLPYVFIGCAITISICLLSFYCAIIYISRLGVIFPNVYIANIDVSGMTEIEAVATLSDMKAEDSTYSVNVTLPDQTLIFTMSCVCSDADIQNAVQKAYQYGRASLTPFEIFCAFMRANWTRYDVQITRSTEIDTEYIEKVISQAESGLNTETTEPQIQIIENSIVITVGSSEKRLDHDRLYAMVYDAFLYQNITQIDFDYEVSRESSIHLDELYEGMTFEAENAYIDENSHEIIEDVSGSVPEIPLETAEEMLKNASDGDVLIFPFTLIEADITRYDLVGISKENSSTSVPVSQIQSTEDDVFQYILSTYTSPYDTSEENRSENLRLACEAIDGTIIEPGEYFSFNDVVGERTSAKGYKEAAVYVSGNTVLQIGGGICQVASTLYCCAMYADLNIVERHPHMYLVTYVPGGLDAAIYWGSLDFQFQNNTDTPIYIEASVSNGNCSISLLGEVPMQYICEIDSECITTIPYNTIYIDGHGDYITGYTGCTYQITRRILDTDGNLIRTDTPDTLGDLGCSVYNKRDEVIYEGN